MREQSRRIQCILTAVCCLFLLNGCGKTTTVKLVDLEDPTTPSVTEGTRSTKRTSEATTVVEEAAEPPEMSTQDEDNSVSQHPEEQGLEAFMSSQTIPIPETEVTQPVECSYILNASSKKIHYPNCSAVKKMANKNKQEYTGTVAELKGMGYSPCGICRPN